MPTSSSLTDIKLCFVSVSLVGTLSYGNISLFVSQVHYRMEIYHCLCSQVHYRMEIYHCLLARLLMTFPTITKSLFVCLIGWQLPAGQQKVWYQCRHANTNHTYTCEVRLV